MLQEWRSNAVTMFASIKVSVSEVSKLIYVHDVNCQLSNHAGVCADQLAKEADIVGLPCILLKDLPVGSWGAGMPVRHLRLSVK